MEIPPEGKIGERLKKEPIREGETAALDLGIWRMDDKTLDEFLNGK